MTTKIIDLDNRIVMDTGEVAFRYPYLERKARSGEDFHGFLALPSTEISLYNRRNPDDKITILDDDGKWIGPPNESYDWLIPKKYQNLDLVELSVQKMTELGLTDGVYQQRLGYELDEMHRRGMFPFIRCVVYVVDKFKEKGIVWGVGRGSSCASLVLFVLGINRVDPVKYDIPIKEFLK